MGTTWTTSMPTGGRSGTRSRNAPSYERHEGPARRASRAFVDRGRFRKLRGEPGRSGPNLDTCSAPHEIQDRKHNYDQDDDANDSKPSEGSDHVTSLHRHELPGQALVQSHPRVTTRQESVRFGTPGNWSRRRGRQMMAVELCGASPEARPRRGRDRRSNIRSRRLRSRTHHEGSEARLAHALVVVARQAKPG
jgi:hypothetical protein